MRQPALPSIVDVARYGPGTLRARFAMAARLLLRRVHLRAVRRLAGVSLDSPAHPFVPTRGDELRVGAYLWCYPLDSETFVRREIRALGEAGIPVTVVADVAGDVQALDPADRALIASTVYLEARRVATRLRWLAGVAVRHPAPMARLLVFLAATRFEREKTVAGDLATLGRATDVAMTMQAHGITHLHAPWSSVNAFVLLLASRLLRLPCSMHARAHDLHRADSAFALAEKFTAAHFVVTNTRYNLDGIRALLPPSRQAYVHLVRNGLDLDEFGPPEYGPDGRAGAREPGPIRLLCVARLIEPKGLTTLLESCAHLRDRGLEFACEIVGGPEEPLYTGYLASLRVRHRQLALHDHVRFSGALPQSAVRAAYRQADVFVLPCVVAANGSKDITPNALIEAMAMQLPVVSTRLTAIPEIVDDEVNGLLVPPGDATALADAIERCLRDAALRERLGREARRKVERTFDRRRNAAAYAALFRGEC